MKYADVYSGGEGFTMVVRMTGGRDERTAAPFMIFNNTESNYPDGITGVAYITGLKGWMDTRVMPKWLSQNRVIFSLPHRRRIIYIDNFSGHTTTSQLTKAMERINNYVSHQIYSFG